MRSTISIFTRIGFLQTLRKILKNMGPHFEWGLLYQLFYKIWILENACSRFKWGLLSRFFTRLGLLKTLRKILKNVGPRFEWSLLSQFWTKFEFGKCGPLLWMRSIVPIFYENRIFANPKENFEKCGSSLWMRSIVPIFYKIWILENAGSHFKWGLLSQFFTKLGFLQTLRKILKNVGPPIEWDFGPD